MLLDIMASWAVEAHVANKNKHLFFSEASDRQRPWVSRSIGQPVGRLNAERLLLLHADCR